MNPTRTLTRRFVLLTVLGLGLSPALTTSSSARGGPDPWRPKRKTPKSHHRRKPGSPRQR